MLTYTSSIIIYFFSSKMISYWYIFNIFVDDEDGGGMALEGLDMENFGFPHAHFESPYSNFQN